MAFAWQKDPVMNWIQYLFRKLVRLGITLFGISLASFLLFHVAPGNPAETILKQNSEKTDSGQIKKLEKQLGLNDPLPVQYGKWIGQLLHGNLGESYITGDPVLAEIGRKWPITARLAVYTFGFIIFCSACGGIFSALFQGGWFDAIHRFWTVLNISIPDYLLGQVLILVFAVKLGLVSFGDGSPNSLILPVLTLGLSISAMQGRVLRTRIIEILSQDYIRFSVAKGLSKTGIMCRHVLKNALGPVLTLWGISLGHLLGGTVIVETIFACPGIGKMGVDAALNRDFPLLQGAVLVMTLSFVVVNQVIDLIYPLLDPKLKKGLADNGAKK
jgi:peptide/nickel transport system permease protein